MKSSVTIRTGSRLHLGIFSAPDPTVGPKFQGAGVMLDEPGFDITLRSDVRDGKHYVGPSCYEDRWATHYEFFRSQFSNCGLSGIGIAINDFVPPHHGLGSGTQFALAVARGLSEFIEQSPKDADSLSAAVKRVSRSSVGTHGFLTGGFIIDGGRMVDDQPSSNFERITFPRDWWIVLITPSVPAGIFGAEEVAAFRQLEPLCDDVYNRLQELLYTEIATSVRKVNFERFAASVSKFGALVGEQFAAIQGGKYRTPQASAIVEQLHQWDIHGVGQSSWGPTLFAFTSSREDAKLLTERCKGVDCFTNCTITIVQAKNEPARVSRQ